MSFQTSPPLFYFADISACCSLHCSNSRLPSSLSKNNWSFGSSILAKLSSACCGISSKSSSIAPHLSCKLADLLGKEDVDVVAALGEGTANQLDGTTDTVGRTYELDLFGEKVTVSVNYDDGKKVSNSYIYLSDQDLDFYKQALETALGAYQDMAQDTEQAEGNGMQSYIWETKQTRITLMRAYDANSIEIIAVQA